MSAVALLLGGTALACVLPLGRHQDQRANVAPVFAGAATFAILHEPGAAHLPVTLGIVALVAGVIAATARALCVGRREVLDVWIVAGLCWFALAATYLLAAVGPQVFWTALLATALLGCRAAPKLSVASVDERADAQAGGAAERARAVSPATVDDLLVRGAHLVDAAGVAIAATVVIAVPGLLSTATLGVDRIGALVLVPLTGGGVVLAARDLRHAAARTALRVAGGCALLAVPLALAGKASSFALTGAAVVVLVVASVFVVVAIGTGRGWRSVAAARWAEAVEWSCTAGAIGAVVVASGPFRLVWELRT